MQIDLNQAQPRSINTWEKRLTRCNRDVFEAFLLRCPLQNLLALAVMFALSSSTFLSCTFSAARSASLFHQKRHALQDRRRQTHRLNHHFLDPQCLLWQALPLNWTLWPYRLDLRRDWPEWALYTCRGGDRKFEPLPGRSCRSSCQSNWRACSLTKWGLDHARIRVHTGRARISAHFVRCIDLVLSVRVFAGP